MHVELVVAKVVTMVIGFVIALTAFRGYRRSGSTPMLYLGLGFTIISIGSVIEGVLYDVLELSIFWAGTVQTSIVAAGMLVILYSLYGGSTGYKLTELSARDVDDPDGEKEG